MIDGHIHFPVNSANPYKDFCAELLRGGGISISAYFEYSKGKGNIH